MNIVPDKISQLGKGFASAAFLSSALLMNAGCESPAPKKDLRQVAESLAKKAEAREQIRASQNEKEQYFIAKLQDLNSIEDKNTLYTQLNDLCKEA
jgi:hypothetical protein